MDRRTRILFAALLIAIVLGTALAAFLLSDLASGVTAEITYVDGGFSNVVGGMAEA